MPKHALLSASSAHRWLNCTAAPHLEATYDDTASRFALEGTIAHEIAEILLCEAVYQDADTNDRLERVRAHDLFYEGMIDEVSAYTDYVMKKFREAYEKDPHAELFIEERIDFSKYVPEGFGTGDAVIVSEGAIEVIDLKFGKGVVVDPYMNPQLMLYGLGALEARDFLYDIHTVTVTVAQVRLDALESFTISADDLRKWGQSIAAIAQEASQGGSTPVPGDWCKFCKFRKDCRERNAYMQTLAKQFAYRDKHTLTDEEMAESLKLADAIDSWAKELKEYALDQALQGTKWPGFKVVEGRSNRKIVNPEAVAKAMMDDGYTEDNIYKPKELQTLTNLEKLAGKKHFSELAGSNIEKPAGKPTLVPESDKRPAIDDITEELEFI